MDETNERQIGDVFLLTTLKVEIAHHGCRGCYFDDADECRSVVKHTGSCLGSQRSDHMSIIFKEVKDGE